MSEPKGKELLVLEQVPQDLIPMQETLTTHAGDFYDGKLFAITPIVQEGEELMEVLLPEEQNIVRALQVCFSHPSSNDFFSLLANISAFFSPFTVCVLQNEISELQRRMAEKAKALSVMRSKRLQEGVQAEMEEEIAEFLCAQSKNIRMYNNIGESKKEFFAAVQKVLDGVTLLTGELKEEKNLFDIAIDLRKIIKSTELALEAALEGVLSPLVDELLQLVPNEKIEQTYERYVYVPNISAYTTADDMGIDGSNWVQGVMIQGRIFLSEKTRDRVLKKIEELQQLNPNIWVVHNITTNTSSWFIKLVVKMPDDEE